MTWRLYGPPLIRPRLPTKPLGVPEFKIELSDFFACGAARWSMALVYQLDPRSRSLQVLDDEGERILRADNYFVVRHMVDVLGPLARRFPLDVDLDIPLTPHGLLVLERPLQPWDDGADLLTGVYWRGTHAIMLLSYEPTVDLVSSPAPPIDLAAPLAEREGWSRPVQEAWRILGALFATLSQRVATATIAPVDRPTRRRLAKARPGVDLPITTRIVELRRSLRPDTGDGSIRSVDWQMRWVVSAHWRRQYHPSTGEHRAKLILPYVKGPDDRPLLVRDTVHRLSR